MDQEISTIFPYFYFEFRKFSYLRGMYTEKDIFFWATSLSVEQDVDLDIAEKAVREALSEHLEEDGTIDDFMAFYQDAAEISKEL